MAFDAIPLEMRLFRQWVCWRYEETESFKPTKVPYSPITGRHADVTSPETWATYEQAVGAMAQTNYYSGVGFVLTLDDPYTFIDLDDPYAIEANGQPKFSNPAEVMQNQIDIYQSCDSYAERSPSGKGLHIICKGEVPSGRKRGAIEVYSNVRFMTMTGEVYRDTSINDCYQQVNQLWERLGAGKSAALFHAGLAEAKLPDEEVLKIANTAANSEKFKDLYYEGNWQKYYPSQSEADFALFDILAFYSENGQQTQRLFLASAIGQREKSRAQYRINYMLARCFDRMLPPVDLEGLKNQLEEAIASKTKLSKVKHEPKPIHEGFPTPTKEIYSLPPGLLGEIANFIYAQAPRPVAEIALAGAIGFMAGIVGRSYNVSGTGLNQYVLLLAATGNGKEAIAGGIDKLTAAVCRTVPSAKDFVGPSKINSEQALIKYLNKKSLCFSSLVGEFGIRIKEMSSHNAAPHMANLLALLLDLFNKSGEGKVVRPSIYSDSDKNTNDIYAPAVTIIGESVPEKFYESLDESMIASGMLPRFQIIEYHGKRPELNENHLRAQPGFELVEKLATLCAYSLTLNSQHKSIHVKYTPEAEDMLRKFDKQCDLNINSSEREVRRHLWNRAHIKVLKLSALVAVGCHPYEPTITPDMVTWAMNITIADINNLLGRFDAGDIGDSSNEMKQMNKVVELVKKYIVSPWADISKSAGETNSHLHSARVIPYGFLQRHLVGMACFRNDRQGSTNAIKRAIKTLVERGDMQEVGRADMTKLYNTTANCYMITKPDAFGL